MMTPRSESRAFPATLEDLGVSWLDGTLHASGALGGDEKIVGFEALPLGEGYGMLGCLARLMLRYETGAGSLGSVIFKCATTSAGNRAVAAAFDMYQRELSFYRLLASDVSELVPACHAATYDPSGDFALLLEDFRDYRRGDQAAGCGVDDARLCVDTLGALHSRWWDSVDDGLLDWVPRPNGNMYKIGMIAGVEAGWGPTLDTFGHLLPDELAGAGPRYLAGLPALHDRMSTGHQTFLHGDFRLDNLLFGLPGADRPLVLVDWQGCIVSKGTQDLAYFLTQNVSTDVRREHETDLVGRYHQGLVDHGVSGYSLDECWDDYRVAALWLWEYAVVIAGTLDPANERGVAFMAGLVERAASSIMDLDVLELLAP
jgi:hypothetical protein